MYLIAIINAIFVAIKAVVVRYSLFPFPVPCSRFPIPDSRFPIPDSRFPTSSSFADPKHPSIHPQYN
ncbi:MAG: hypothetical protein F6K65_41145 [Moorea sp. SIO3C2]|nr:hypothetical protein [Moorena sp. SIO3C2]